jgi:GMP synthase-like glutamine amidotransferase
MNVHCLAHVPFEDAANIGAWVKLRGHSLTYTHFFKDETLPSLDSFEMLAIMGGLMNVYEYDEYPWLKPEKEFIRRAIEADKKIVGVCLGAQLLADVLGGRVTANAHKEIGWHTVKLSPQAVRSKAFSTMPLEMQVFQWHGDTFSLPPEAIHLATNDVCINQAFQYKNNVLALQFHLEYSQDSIEKMLIHCVDELVEAPYIQTADQIRDGYDNIARNTAWLYTLLDEFAGI